MILSPRATQMFSAAARAGVAVVLAAGVFAAQPPLSTGHAAAVRIKDITDFEGIRENMLVGYGLVVGLNGTGDSLNNSPFTRQSLEAMLERLGVNTRDGNINTDNVAAVMVHRHLACLRAPRHADRRHRQLPRRRGKSASRDAAVT